MMPEAFDRWWNEFKYESPWYFWVYSLLLPLGLLFFFEPSLAFCMLVSQGIATWLLKKWGLLEQKWLYALSLGSIFAAEHITRFILGDSLHMFFYKTCGTTYPLVYNVIVFGIIADILSFICVYCVNKKVVYALQSSICILFLVMANSYGLIIIWSVFALMFKKGPIC